jgi:hypothetical protein
MIKTILVLALLAIGVAIACKLFEKYIPLDPDDE